MEIWKTLRVSHISTPPTATTNYCLKRRYTNIPLGTKKAVRSSAGGEALRGHAWNFGRTGDASRVGAGHCDEIRPDCARCRVTAARRRAQFAVRESDHYNSEHEAGANPGAARATRRSAAGSRPPTRQLRSECRRNL